MLDNQVQKITNFNIQDRRSKLQKQVDNLSKEQKADYKKERESFDTATQSYF
jgi:environmental stress-induced protein Ves